MDVTPSLSRFEFFNTNPVRHIGLNAWPACAPEWPISIHPRVVLDAAVPPSEVGRQLHRRTLTALAQLVAAVLFVIGLRLYERPVRASGTPYVTNPTRRWARLAFAMLLTAAAANLGIATAEMLGLTTTVTQLSAALRREDRPT